MVGILDPVQGCSVGQSDSDCQSELANGVSFRREQGAGSSDNLEPDMADRDAWGREVLVLHSVLVGAFLEADACRVVGAWAFRLADEVDGPVVVASVRLSSSSEGSGEREAEQDN